MSKRLSCRGLPCWPIVILLLLPFLVFGPALLPGKVLSPADVLALYYPWHAVLPGHTPGNPLLADQALQFHPWLLYAAKEIRAGRFPLWNPHAYAGAPFLANAQSALLSPFTALAYLLPVPLALGLAAIGKLAVAGLSTYWLLRLLGCGLFGATLGGVTFMFNGFLIVWLGHPHSAVAVWLPALVAATEWLRQAGSRWALGVLTGVVAVQFLGGHPETSLHILAATGLYGLYRLRGPGGRRFAIQFGCACLAGFFLAAIQVFPFYEYMLGSSTLYYRERLASGEFGSVASMLPAWASIVWLVPRYFGDPVTGNYWGPANYNEISGYVGIIPLVLLPFAAVRSDSQGRRRAFFWGLLVLTPLVVYDLTPAPFWLHKLPGFSVSANTRLILVISFAAAVLAGVGADRLAGRDHAGSRIAWVVKVLFVAALAAVGWQLWQDRSEVLAGNLIPYVSLQILLFIAILAAAALLVLRSLRRGVGIVFSAGLLALVIVDLLRVAYPYNPVIERQAFYPSTPALEFLRGDPDGFRVLLPLPNLGIAYRLSDVAGYDAMTPRQVELLVDATQSVGPVGSGILRFTEGLESPLLDLLNVKYVLLPPGETLPPGKFALAYAGPDARIYRNLNAFPRAFLAFRTRSCLEDGEALKLLKGRALDLRKEAVVHTCDPLPPGSEDAGGTAEVIRYRPGRVVVRSKSSHPAVLVLADTYDPGWQVTVDGKPGPLYRANYALRAVVVPGGTHEVAFRYRPWSVRVGAGVSIGTAITLGVFLVGGAARVRAAAAALLALLLFPGVAASHSPPPPLLGLRLQSETIVSGERLRAVITLRDDASTGLPDAPVDLYVALIASRRMVFLDAAGQWQAWPVPHQRARPLSRLAGLEIAGVVDRSLRGARFHTLAVGFVHPGRNPLDHHNWVAGALTTPVRFPFDWALTTSDRIWLGALLVMALVALVVVLAG